MRRFASKLKAHESDGFAKSWPLAGRQFESGLEANPSVCLGQDLSQTSVNLEPNRRVTPAVGGRSPESLQRWNLASINVFPKLSMSQPGDQYEQAADREADRVTRISSVERPSAFRAKRS